MDFVLGIVFLIWSGGLIDSSSAFPEYRNCSRMDFVTVPFSNWFRQGYQLKKFDVLSVEACARECDNAMCTSFTHRLRDESCSMWTSRTRYNSYALEHYVEFTFGERCSACFLNSSQLSGYATMGGSASQPIVMNCGLSGGTARMDTARWAMSLVCPAGHVWNDNGLPLRSLTCSCDNGAGWPQPDHSISCVPTGWSYLNVQPGKKFDVSLATKFDNVTTLSGCKERCTKPSCPALVYVPTQQQCYTVNSSISVSPPSEYNALSAHYPIYMESAVDIDECSLNTDGCSQNCLNTLGSYNCTCNEGYKQNKTDRHICDDIDECSLNTDGCSQNCLNTPGSYNCTCNDGYEQNKTDRHICDVRPCNRGVNNTNVCQYNGTCTERNGFAKCECKFGYVGERCETDEWWNPIVLIVRILQWLKWINLYDGRKWAEIIDESTAMSLITDYSLGGEQKLFESLSTKIKEKEEMEEDAEKKREKARVTEKEKQTRAENQQKERVVSNRARGPANRDRAAGRRRGKRASDQMPYASQKDSKAAHRELERYMKRLGLRNK